MPYVKGDVVSPGQPNEQQLVQGDAQNLNDQAAMIQQTTPDSPPTAPQGQAPTPQGPDEDGFDLSGRQEPLTKLQTEDDQLLYDKTERPGERITTGTGNPLPPEAYRYLGALARATQDPNAPPQLFQILQLMNQEMGL